MDEEQSEAPERREAGGRGRGGPGVEEAFREETLRGGGGRSDWVSGEALADAVLQMASALLATVTSRAGGEPELRFPQLPRTEREELLADLTKMLASVRLPRASEPAPVEADVHAVDVAGLSEHLLAKLLAEARPKDDQRGEQEDVAATRLIDQLLARLPDPDEVSDPKRWVEEALGVLPGLLRVLLTRSDSLKRDDAERLVDLAWHVLEPLSRTWPERVPEAALTFFYWALRAPKFGGEGASKAMTSMSTRHTLGRLGVWVWRAGQLRHPKALVLACEGVGRFLEWDNTPDQRIRWMHRASFRSALVFAEHLSDALEETGRAVEPGPGLRVVLALQAWPWVRRFEEAQDPAFPAGLDQAAHRLRAAWGRASSETGSVERVKGEADSKPEQQQEDDALRWVAWLLVGDPPFWMIRTGSHAELALGLGVGLLGWRVAIERDPSEPDASRWAILLWNAQASASRWLGDGDGRNADSEEQRLVAGLSAWGLAFAAGWVARARDAGAWDGQPGLEELVEALVGRVLRVPSAHEAAVAWVHAWVQHGLLSSGCLEWASALLGRPAPKGAGSDPVAATERLAGVLAQEAWEAANAWVWKGSALPGDLPDPDRGDFQPLGETGWRLAWGITLGWLEKRASAGLPSSFLEVLDAAAKPKFERWVQARWREAYDPGQGSVLPVDLGLVTRTDWDTAYKEARELQQAFQGDSPAMTLADALELLFSRGRKEKARGAPSFQERLDRAREPLERAQLGVLLDQALARVRWERSGASLLDALRRAVPEALRRFELAGGEPLEAAIVLVRRLAQLEAPRPWPAHRLARVLWAWWSQRHPNEPDAWRLGGRLALLCRTQQTDFERLAALHYAGALLDHLGALRGSVLEERFRSEQGLEGIRMASFVVLDGLQQAPDSLQRLVGEGSKADLDTAAALGKMLRRWAAIESLLMPPDVLGPVPSETLGRLVFERRPSTIDSLLPGSGVARHRMLVAWGLRASYSEVDAWAWLWSELHQVKVGRRIAREGPRELLAEALAGLLLEGLAALLALEGEGVQLAVRAWSSAAALLLGAAPWLDGWRRAAQGVTWERGESTDVGVGEQRSKEAADVLVALALLWCRRSSSVDPEAGRQALAAWQDMLERMLRAGGAQWVRVGPGGERLESFADWHAKGGTWEDLERLARQWLVEYLGEGANEPLDRAFGVEGREVDRLEATVDLLREVLRRFVASGSHEAGTGADKQVGEVLSVTAHRLKDDAKNYVVGKDDPISDLLAAWRRVGNATAPLSERCAATEDLRQALARADLLGERLKPTPKSLLDALQQIDLTDV